MATKKASSSKPSGLAITRNGAKFAISWKLPSGGYGSQQLEYRLNGKKKWTSVSVGASTKTKTVTVTVGNYFPAKKTVLNTIEFRVRGKKAQYTKSGTTYVPDWSGWATKKFSVKTPHKPKLTATLDNSHTNVIQFKWTTTSTAKEAEWLRDVEWQTLRVANSTIKDGSKLTWKSTAAGWNAGTGSANGTQNVTEETTVIADGSCTRWFRVRARGPHGATAWKYAKHVFAEPYQAAISDVSTTPNNAGGVGVKIKWAASTDAAHPIDATIVEYKIVTPGPDMACPSGNWTTANTSKDTSGSDAAFFMVDDLPGVDQALYVRVNTKHDAQTTAGIPELAMVGTVADPEEVSVATNAETHMATINATNRSAIQDAFLAVLYRRASAPNEDYVIAIIPPGQASITMQCPDWGSDTIAFGVYAAVGSYDLQEREDGTACYAVEPVMRSAATIWDGGEVPQAPSNVSLSETDVTGTVRVTWDWSWEEADSAVLSWANHKDAWESTDEPSEYTISNLHAAQWNISGLTIGETWYVRVRLIRGQTMGPWSDIAVIDLSSPPVTPYLILDQDVIAEDGSVTASWVYVSNDGTMQAYAEICEAELTGGEIVYGDIIAHTETAQHITINAEDVGWEVGNTYNLCVRVSSASGRTSPEWSDPVPVTVAARPEISITATSLEEITITDDVEQHDTRTELSLTEMPLEVTISGTGSDGNTLVVIERAQDYHVDRPDETEFNGYEGEAVAILNVSGEGTFEITEEDLQGALDDGAAYKLTATVRDGLGQSAEDAIEFEVHWTHQAVMPVATAEIDDAAAKITIGTPVGYAAGDTCDIYRLSADRPELIVSGAEMGSTYVDPYPAIGESGGHRVVYKTKNGDYITADNQPAWIDLQEDAGDILRNDRAIIDFDGYQIQLAYNVDVSSSWKKDFQETMYLGGSVQGDWNPGVRRTASVSGVTIVTEDPDEIFMLRRLAVYTGICHVRTPDGSSYAADIQVSESRGYKTAGKVAEFSLSITRVDTEELDGVPLETWETE